MMPRAALARPFADLFTFSFSSPLRSPALHLLLDFGSDVFGA